MPAFQSKPDEYFCRAYVLLAILVTQCNDHNLHCLVLPLDDSNKVNDSSLQLHSPWCLYLLLVVTVVVTVIVVTVIVDTDLFYDAFSLYIITLVILQVF